MVASDTKITKNVGEKEKNYTRGFFKYLPFYITIEPASFHEYMYYTKNTLFFITCCVMCILEANTRSNKYHNHVSHSPNLLMHEPCPT